MLAKIMQKLEYEKDERRTLRRLSAFGIKNPFLFARSATQISSPISLFEGKAGKIPPVSMDERTSGPSSTFN
jgi:hypothetical protein